MKMKASWEGLMSYRRLTAGRIRHFFSSALLGLSMLLLAFSLSPVYGQTMAEKKEWFETGNYFFDSEDYQEAVFYFLKLHDANPTNANYNFLVGSCYLNIPGNEIKSIPYFEQAVTKIATKYKNELTQIRAPLHAYFYLAQAYRMNNQMDKAMEMLDKFTNSPYFEGNYNEAIVNAEIEACKKAKVIQDKPIQVTFTNLGSVINNSSENYDPVLTQDTSIIIYMNNLKFYNAIYMSKRENGAWTEPENITPQVGSDGDAYPTSISVDGKTLYLVRKVKKNGDIFVSHYENGKWSIMQPLNENINSNRKETFASISADGKILYFTSDRRGGEGGLDIWYSELQPNGQWGKAKNMGPQVNTKLDEETPCISADGTTLFFSSQGHQNMGGFDIFYSLRLNNEWSGAVNIGSPLNTTLDDKFYFPIGNGLIGYIARRLPSGFGLQDIYRVQITGGDPVKDLAK